MSEWGRAHLSERASPNSLRAVVLATDKSRACYIRPERSIWYGSSRLDHVAVYYYSPHYTTLAIFPAKTCNIKRTVVRQEYI